MTKRRNPELLPSSLPDKERHKKKKEIGSAAVFLAGKNKTEEKPPETKEQ